MHHKSKRFKHLEKRATRFVLNFSSYLVEKETDTFGHSLRTSSDDPSDKFCVNITFSYQELNIEDRQSPYFLVVANFERSFWDHWDGRGIRLWLWQTRASTFCLTECNGSPGCLCISIKHACFIAFPWPLHHRFFRRRIVLTECASCCRIQGCCWKFTAI